MTAGGCSRAPPWVAIMTTIPPPAPLRQHRPGVWIKESWLRFSGLTLQTRMVLLKAQDGLVLYSPSPATLDAATIEEIRALGEPSWLIAPNEIHNVGLRAFQGAFPQAHTTGCAGHPRRVRGIHFDALLDARSAPDAVPWTRSGELRFHIIGGNRLLHEIALFHVSSPPSQRMQLVIRRLFGTCCLRESQATAFPLIAEFPANVQLVTSTLVPE